MTSQPSVEPSVETLAAAAANSEQGDIYLLNGPICNDAFLGVVGATAGEQKAQKAIRACVVERRNHHESHSGAVVKISGNPGGTYDCGASCIGRFKSDTKRG